jgi:hypothetical protein
VLEIYTQVRYNVSTKFIGGSFMEQIPLETQTLYAELLDQIRILEARRSVGHLKGGFTTKKSGGHSYYYFNIPNPEVAASRSILAKKARQLSVWLKNGRRRKTIRRMICRMFNGFVPKSELVVL